LHQDAADIESMHRSMKTGHCQGKNTVHRPLFRCTVFRK
jgi:hypothetical protein